MVVGLDVPQRIIVGRVLVTCNLLISYPYTTELGEADLLLFKSPFR
jgi:hypothetical protein